MAAVESTKIPKGESASSEKTENHIVCVMTHPPSVQTIKPPRIEIHHENPGGRNQWRNALFGVFFPYVIGFIVGTLLWRMWNCASVCNEVCKQNAEVTKNPGDALPYSDEVNKPLFFQPLANQDRFLPALGPPPIGKRSDEVKGQLFYIPDRTLPTLEVETNKDKVQVDSFPLDQFRDLNQGKWEVDWEKHKILQPAQTPDPTVTSTPADPAPKLLPPRFFLDDHFNGAWFEPAEDWATKGCINLPKYISGQVSAVKFGGNYSLTICADINCQTDPNASWWSCREISPETPGLHDFRKIPFWNDRVQSFCFTKEKY